MVATYIPGPHGPIVMASTAGGGGAAPTWTKTGNPASQNTGTTSVTFTSVSIGTASSDRIVVAVYNSASAVATAMTIGGITATKAVEESSGISGLQIWYAPVPTGTTANIVATSGGAMSNESVIVGILTGVTAAPPITNTTPPASTSPATISVNVPSTGFGIVGIYQGGTTSGAWTNATQDFLVADASGNKLIMANDSTSGTNSVTITTFNSEPYHVVSASWGP